MAKPKKPAKGTTKPKQTTNAINLAALKAQALAVKHQVKIGGRLSPAFLLAFAADLAAIVTAVPAVITARDGQVQLTAQQTTALSTAYNLAKGIKTTVKSHNPDKDVLLAYGVGAPVNKLSVPQVTAAVQKILDRLAAAPAEATAFGIIDLDVKALQDALQAIKDADLAQEAARAAVPQTTAQRNATARSLLAGIKKIAGAGMRTFMDDAAVYAEFEGLIPKGTG